MQKVIQTLPLQIWGSEGDGSTFSRKVSPVNRFLSPASTEVRKTAATYSDLCRRHSVQKGTYMVCCPRWWLRTLRYGGWAASRMGRKLSVKGSFPPSRWWRYTTGNRWRNGSGRVAYRCTSRRAGRRTSRVWSIFWIFTAYSPPAARAWKGAPTLENFGRKDKNSHQRSLLDFFALAEKSFQLSPVCS